MLQYFRVANLTTCGRPAQVPIWFCVACPVVLGLMAPFLFNLGSGAVAQALCDRFALPPDECNDVWCAPLPGPSSHHRCGVSFCHVVRAWTCKVVPTCGVTPVHHSFLKMHAKCFALPAKHKCMDAWCPPLLGSTPHQPFFEAVFVMRSTHAVSDSSTSPGQTS